MKHDKKTKKLHKKMGWAEWTLVGIVIVSTLAIVIAICTIFRDTPAEKADKELVKLADKYYVEYLYPRLLGGKMESDPAPILETYGDSGVPTTYLRQLLHYNNDENAELSEVFENVGCNTNYTGVRYFPRAPYGPKDYEVIYLWKCEDR